MASHAQETIIAQGVKVEGDFSADGDVVIDGDLSGNVSTTQSLRIGESAHIQANVAAQNAVFAGTIVGNVKVTGRLELLETSSVEGDIVTETLSVALGARINGHISMSGADK